MCEFVVSVYTAIMARIFTRSSYTNTHFSQCCNISNKKSLINAKVDSMICTKITVQAKVFFELLPKHMVNINSIVAHSLARSIVRLHTFVSYTVTQIRTLNFSTNQYSNRSTHTHLSSENVENYRKTTTTTAICSKQLMCHRWQVNFFLYIFVNEN